MKIALTLLILFPLLMWAEKPAGLADELYAQKLYRDAAVEYLRLIHADTSGTPGTYHLKLARCYAKIGRPEEALRICRGLEKGNLAGEALLVTGEIELEAGKYQRETERLKDRAEPVARLMNGYALFKLGQVREAAGSFAEVPQTDQLYHRARSLKEYLEAPHPVKRKSYTLAGLFSLVPGCGHYYTGRYGDGIYSQLLIGTLGALAWYYYGNDARGRAIAAGSVTGFFYAGSIYGALMSVKLFNRDEREKFDIGFDELYRGKR